MKKPELSKKFLGSGNPFFGKHHSTETIKRISESLKGRNLGDENTMWKGGDVGYASLHEYVRNHLPKPELCQSCGVKPALDLANKGGYDRDIKNWGWLCRSCHMKKDGRMKNLWRGIEDKRRWKPPKVRYGPESPNWKGGFRSKDPIEYFRVKQKQNYWKKKRFILSISPILGILSD